MIGEDAHARRVSSGMSFITFMQGGNRAPRLIKALDEGPNIGLMVGYMTSVISDYSQNRITEKLIP